MYIGTQPAIGQNRKLDSIAASFNGVLTTFNLTVNTSSIIPSNVYQLFISLGGVLQNPGVDFTANGNQITFTTAPTAGLSFFGIFQGDSITGTLAVADASITTLKLATGLTVTHAVGTAAAPSITFVSDLANGAFAPAANTFGISTAGTERLRIDSSGRLLAGTSTARNNFFGTTLSAVAQVEGTGGATGRGALSVINNDVSNNPPYVLLGRSGAASLGSNAIVVNGSRLGTLTFHGADGTSFIEAATVAGEVDGTPGSTDMPGRLVFSTTADGAASPTERMRIDSSGRLLVGTSSSSATCTAAFASRSDAGAAPLIALHTTESTVTDGNNFGALSFGNTAVTGINAGAFILGQRDGGTWTNNSSMPGRLVFATTASGSASPTERMRLGSTGTLYAYANGTTAYFSSGTGAGTGESVFVGAHSATATTGTGTISIRIWTNGNVVNTNNSYGAISDIKLKENIVDATSQWSDLKALQVRKYNFKEGQTHTQIGLVAQEAELISPGLVSESPDRDAEGNDLGTVTKSVNYSVLYMKAVKALQEAMERIETLETSNLDLLARVTALETT